MAEELTMAATSNGQNMENGGQKTPIPTTMSPSAGGIPPLNFDDMDSFPDSLDLLLWTEDEGRTTTPIHSDDRQIKHNIRHNPRNPKDSTKSQSPSKSHPESPVVQQLPPQHYEPMNAVHMEIQENAKIPNLYQLPMPVDRSTSYRQSAAGTVRARNSNFSTDLSKSNNGSSTSHEEKKEGEVNVMDEIMRLDEEDCNLTEKFLGSNHRSSAAAAYSNAGALLSSIGTRIGMKVDQIKKDDSRQTSSENNESDNGYNDNKPKEGIEKTANNGGNNYISGTKIKHGTIPNPLLVSTKNMMENTVKNDKKKSISVSNVGVYVAGKQVDLKSHSAAVASASKTSRIEKHPSVHISHSTTTNNPIFEGDKATAKPNATVTAYNYNHNDDTESPTSAPRTGGQVVSPTTLYHCYPYGRPVPLPIPTRARSPSSPRKTHSKTVPLPTQEALARQDKTYNPSSLSTATTMTSTISLRPHPSSPETGTRTRHAIPTIRQNAEKNKEMRAPIGSASMPTTALNPPQSTHSMATKTAANNHDNFPIKLHAKATSTQPTSLTPPPPRPRTERELAALRHALGETDNSKRKIKNQSPTTPPGGTIYPRSRNTSQYFYPRPINNINNRTKNFTTSFSPSVMKATVQRSQFGFGGNHVVPSVPMPPVYNNRSRSGAPVSVGVAKAPATGNNVITSSISNKVKGKGFSSKIQKSTSKKNVVHTAGKTIAQGTSPPEATDDEKTSSNTCSNPTLAGPSYERKKQRAKDARIRLNESIERLAVSISVAGTQSKQRISQLRVPASPNNSSKSSPTNNSKSKFRDGCKASTIKIIEDVINAADTAKKWDRPSFVGSAAAMVQGLNAQCEALMGEIIDLRIERADYLQQQTEISSSSSSSSGPSLSAQTGPTATATSIPLCKCGGTIESNVVGVGTTSVGGVCGSGGVPPSVISHSDSSYRDEMDKDVQAPSSKKIKLEHPIDNSNVVDSLKSRIALEEKIVDISDVMECVIANTIDVSTKAPISGTATSAVPLSHLVCSFLDPKSLIRCLSVSQSWSKLDCFTNSDIWVEHCVSRFGRSNMRHWQEKQDDEEDMDTKLPPWRQEKINVNDSMMRLFQYMNTMNVKPNCLFEGNRPLGSAKMNNIVSAWVSCVERSNGETMRSVSIDRGVASYSSLPVVEIRILIQNTGMADGVVYVPEQILSIDASTRRRGEEMFEITSDDRLVKKAVQLDGSPVVRLRRSNLQAGSHFVGDLFKLKLYESVVLVAYFHARSCSTSSKFRQRAKFMKVLIRVNGTTMPIVIPFSREKSEPK